MNRQEKELLDKLYGIYSNDLYRIARGRLADEDIARDAVQIVFMIASIKIDIIMQHENKKLWLYQTLGNVVKRILYDKKYTKDKQLREVLTDSFEEQGYIQEYEFEKLGVIEELKDTLREREYRYLVERFANQRSNQEIAEIFGLSYSGATSLGDRVLKKVKKYLEKTGKND